jgi:hypothetical protein
MEDSREEIFNDKAVDRRRFIKRAAVTAAWATPTIMTLTAGTAAASHNCAKAGQTCTPNGDVNAHQHPKPCCSGLTCAPSRNNYRCV